MKNVQISFDEKLLDAVDRLVASSKQTRSAIVRQALRHWLRQKRIKGFEQQWIRSLRQNPGDAKEAEAWIRSQTWSD